MLKVKQIYLTVKGYILTFKICGYIRMKILYKTNGGYRIIKKKKVKKEDKEDKEYYYYTDSSSDTDCDSD